MNPITIEPFDLAGVTPEAYAALHAHRQVLRAERQPDDPATTLEDMIQNMRTIPPFVQMAAWVVWDAAREAILAEGNAVRFRVGENAHLVQFDISVLPAYRRQGLGRAMLAEIVAMAQAEERRLLVTMTNGRVPAGAAFMQRIGARPGMETHVNQLDLAELDRALLADWLGIGTARQDAYELGLWDGPFPEADIAAAAELMTVMNQAPHGDIELNDMQFTPEQLRQMEANEAARGISRWIYYVRERTSGELVGFTATHWLPSRPQLLSQGDTGVFPAHRGQGLGKWLKAAMLQKVLAERPQVRHVRTGNADSNAPMLAINHALGFRPYLSQCIWQVEVETAAAYLG
ncbi:MAG: GNAT family N-acetyltransferase [Anaerolineales bacterium]|nr:GNAT family N-acetyltransferase [Anaerolineales bacterium]